MFSVSSVSRFPGVIRPQRVSVPVLFGAKRPIKLLVAEPDPTLRKFLVRMITSAASPTPLEIIHPCRFFIENILECIQNSNPDIVMLSQLLNRKADGGDQIVRTLRSSTKRPLPLLVGCSSFGFSVKLDAQINKSDLRTKEDLKPLIDLIKRVETELANRD